MLQHRPLSVLVTCLFLSTALAQEEKPDANSVQAKPSPAVAKVIELGKNGNKVQEHLDYLTNRIGPRLTGSEGLQAACEWARDEFKKMGLESRLEQWGEFPVGFERGPSYGRMVSPKVMKLDFGTNAWTAGTRGRVVGRVVLAPKTLEQVEAMKEQLEGAYVLVQRPPRRRRSRGPRTAPPAKPADTANSGNTKEDAKDTPDEKRSDDKAKKPTESSKQDDKPKQTKSEPKPMTREQLQALYDAIKACNPAGIISNTSGELILTGGSYKVNMDELPTIPRITLLKSQWDEVKAMVDEGKEVELEFDIRNHFRKGPIPLYNVIADIPGTEWPDQYVIVGGHIDSWDGATGATDNAAGCATTLEAARLLMAAGAKPKRTIRFMLWSGEEQGLLGSRAYVEKHKKDVAKNVSAVFVHDGGTNYVAGIRGTKAMIPDFETVFASVRKMNPSAPFDIAEIPSIRARGGSDHVPFIRAGVPGFFWMQRGRAVYRTTHHTQYDTFESIVPEYQEHSSIVIAVGALGTANLDHLLPRDGIATQ